MTLRIRPWRSGDAELIRQSSANLSPESLWRRFGVGMNSLPRPYLELLRSETREARFFLAFDDDQLIGWAEAHPVGDGEAEIAVVVLDGWQRQGVGTKLVRALTKDAELTGRRIHAYVQPGNVAARSLVRAAVPAPIESTVAGGFVHYRQTAA